MDEKTINLIIGCCLIPIMFGFIWLVKILADKLDKLNRREEDAY
jgi:hypothetical protein